jgi:hypothetical protein
VRREGVRQGWKQAVQTLWDWEKQSEVLDVEDDASRKRAVEDDERFDEAEMEDDSDWEEENEKTKSKEKEVVKGGSVGEKGRNSGNGERNVIRIISRLTKKNRTKKMLILDVKKQLPETMTVKFALDSVREVVRGCSDNNEELLKNVTESLVTLARDVPLLNYELQCDLFWRKVVEDSPEHEVLGALGENFCYTPSSEAEAEREIKELAAFIGDDRVNLSLETRFNIMMVKD